MIGGTDGLLQTMLIRHLQLANFGPFRRYSVSLDALERPILLLTGRNNEGKSNLLFALRLVAAAATVTNIARHRIVIDGAPYYQLRQQDIVGLNIGRLVHNYAEEVATVTVQFEGGGELTVYVDPKEDMIYADSRGRLPRGIAGMIGFIPPLGPVAEEELLLTAKHVRNSVDTSLAPRHLRNHFVHLLNPDEVDLVRHIVGDSWEDITLLNVEHDVGSNRVTCFYREGRIDREIAWAGQGLQVWFQIVTHLVRLRQCGILVLDEPEINLHPEKQNDLMRLLREYFSGAVIVATHSVELMNNVDVSHIIHVQKRKAAPVIKRADDRKALDIIRARVGSTFNLIASQFENVDLVLFTEDRGDFLVLERLALGIGLTLRTYNVPLHGFSEYRKALFFRDAYNHLIGESSTRFVAILDRDYYPPRYLEQVGCELAEGGVALHLTPGKEMENIWLHPGIIRELLSESERGPWRAEWEQLGESYYADIVGSATKLYREFSEGPSDLKDVTKAVLRDVNAFWQDEAQRYLVMPGKPCLARLRHFYRTCYGVNLTSELLVAAATEAVPEGIQEFINKVYERNE